LIKTNGRQAVPLDGLWLRTLCLHNGSVPNLTGMLEPPGKRSKAVIRGYDVYDPVKVGFNTGSASARRAGFRFDTSERANANQGHLGGTTLPAPQKAALIEYLKSP
jgi:hypothetical protein